jgi:putative protease
VDHNIKSYLTVNTIIYDNDMDLMRKVVDAAKERTFQPSSQQCGSVDVCPSIGVEIHLSTQLNISNTESLKFYAHLPMWWCWHVS